MILKIKRINEITVQTLYSCRPDSTEAPSKCPNHAIKPNYISQMKSLIGNKSLKKLK